MLNAKGFLKSRYSMQTGTAVGATLISDKINVNLRSNSQKLPQ